MKIRIFAILVCIAVLVFSACVKISDGSESSQKAEMAALEKKLELIIIEQRKENDEKSAELDELRAEIELLKKENGITVNTGTSSSIDSARFLYELKEGRAVITGYTGADTYVVIPSHIDGYEVEGVGERAFASTKISTVIISEGVKSIDWFAFYTCPQLTSITLPKSIESIGYAAFDGASSAFTVYCQVGTYAHSFAKSYGIPCVAV